MPGNASEPPLEQSGRRKPARKLSPNQARKRQVKEGNYGVPEHDVVSLTEAVRRTERIDDADESCAEATHHLRQRELKEQRRIARAMARLEDSDGDHDGGSESSGSSGDDGAAAPAESGAASASRVARRLHKATAAAGTLRTAAAERVAVEQEFAEYLADEDVKPTREHMRVLHGRQALIAAQDNKERSARDPASPLAASAARTRALDYSMDWSMRSPDIALARSTVAAPMEASKVVHPTAWVSRASGKPPPQPKPKPAPDATHRAHNHQPAFAVVSGVVGFGDGSPVERVDIDRAVVVDDEDKRSKSRAGSRAGSRAPTRAASRQESPREHKPAPSGTAAAKPSEEESAKDDGAGAADSDKDDDEEEQGNKDPQHQLQLREAEASDEQAAAAVVAGNRFRAWNRRIVQLAGTMQAGKALREAAECIEALEATPPSDFAGGAVERHGLLAVTHNNHGLMQARAHRPVQALECFALALEAEEQAARTGVPTPSTLVNVAAVLFDLKRYNEARAIAVSIVDGAARHAREQQQQQQQQHDDEATGVSPLADDDAPPTADPVMDGEGAVSSASPSTDAGVDAAARSGGEVAAHDHAGDDDAGQEEPLPPAMAVPDHLVVLAERQIILCDEAFAAAGNSRSRRSLELSRASPAPRESSKHRVRPWRRKPQQQAHNETAATLQDVSAISDRPHDESVLTTADASRGRARRTPDPPKGASHSLNNNNGGSRSRYGRTSSATGTAPRRAPNVARLLEFSTMTLGSHHPATQVVRTM